MKHFDILVVDDEEAMRESLAAWLIKEGYGTDTACGGKEAIALLGKHNYDIVLVDIRMPGMDGITLLKEIRKAHPEILVVIITAYGSIETAVEAMKYGASDYLLKPFDPEHLMLLITKLSEQKALRDENVYLRDCLLQKEDLWLDDLIGQSPEMKKVFKEIDTLAGTDTPVLITGETGTGKELAARAIHSRSLRAFCPFIAINCGAMNRQLLESELFGHERGAFTGAVQAKRGRLELANSGTLFLDEIGEISPAMQISLLRVLEEKRFVRLGGTRELTSDFRLISATHRDLKTEVDEGRFRPDFFFRVNIINITMPPLRQRKIDIPLLAFHFLERFSAEMGKSVQGFSKEALEILKSYEWPGNVRELKNVIERAVVLCRQKELEKKDLTFLEPESPGIRSDKTLKAMEREYILRTLEANDWHLTRSAAILGIDRGTLRRKINDWNLTQAGDQKP